MDINSEDAPSMLRFQQSLSDALKHLTTWGGSLNQLAATPRLAAKREEEHTVLVPLRTLLGRRFKPCIIGNSVPAPHQLFGNLEDHHQRFLPLQQMNERHPRVLANITGI
jgi:hypothetical protein